MVPMLLNDSVISETRKLYKEISTNGFNYFSQAYEAIHNYLEKFTERKLDFDNNNFYRLGTL